MAGRYAADTSVSSDKSRAEIEQILTRWGADAFMYAPPESQAMIQFTAHDRIVRFVLPMPDRLDREFTHTPSRGTKRTEAQAYAQWEQACRQRWRALALAIKAKLEAVEVGIAEFEGEFLNHIVAADGRTIGEHVRPQIATMYESGQVPDFFGGLKALGAGE